MNPGAKKRLSLFPGRGSITIFKMRRGWYPLHGQGNRKKRFSLEPENEKHYHFENHSHTLFGQLLEVSLTLRLPANFSPVGGNGGNMEHPSRQAESQRSRHTVAHSKTEASIPRVSSSELLGDGRLVVIEHAGQEYQLRLTSSGKLILTK